jgi:histidinol phosphatase-like PHP family hydrolase
VPYSRRTFLETTLIAGTTLAAALRAKAGGPLKPDFGLSGDSKIAHSPSEPTSTNAPPKPSFPVADYHVHLSNTLTIDQAVQLAKDRGVQIGILEHPGPGFPLNTDADLQSYIDKLRKYPVRIGVQPVYPGWSKSFSKPVLDQLDYILMDALTLPNPDGTFLAIWQIDTMVDDAEQFMQRYMQFIEQVLTTEQIDIFGWPTFLPVPIARQYAQLWTPERVNRIIDLAKQRKVAIEINELAHVPDERFIIEAKRAGLKFTFGTDSRNQHAAHFYYCYQMAHKCGLTEQDMFVVKRR